MKFWSRAGVFLLLLSLSLFCLSTVVADPVTDQTDVTLSTSPENETNASVAEELQSASGEVTVLVDFEQATTKDTSIEELKRHANRSQSVFLEFANQRAGVTVENRFWITNSVLATVDTSRVSVDTVAGVEGVNRLEVNAKVSVADTAESVGGVPISRQQSQTDSETPAVRDGIEEINATRVWREYDARGDGVRVAVLDTGVDVDHPDIDLYTEDSTDPTYPGGWAEFDEDGSRVGDTVPRETERHGTHVSGIVAGGNESGEYIGVAPEAELMHGLVLPNDDGTTSQVLGGIEWAVANDADVLVMSLGSQNYNGLFIEAIENARANDVAVVASIGNNGPGTSTSPGNIYGTFSVGAFASDGEVWGSSGGEQIVVEDAWHPLFESETEDWPEEYVVPTAVAPGKSVKSAAPDGEYRRATGTSMAAPHVGGAIAVVQSATEADLSAPALTHALEQTASKPADWSVPTDEQDTRYGYGRIDVAEAVDQIKSDQLRREFQIIYSYVNSTTVTVGDRVKAAAVVENQGNLDGAYNGDFEVNGLPYGSSSVVVPAGKAESVALSVSFPEPGTYNFSLDGTDIGTVTVEWPDLYEVTNATVDNETVEVGDSVVVSANITSTAAEQQTVGPRLVVNGEVVAQRVIELGVNETRQISFERTFSTAGEYTVAIDDETVGTVLAEYRESPSEWYYKYTGSNGIVNSTALDTAVEDYFDDKLSQSRLHLLMQSHALEKPVAELV